MEKFASVWFFLFVWCAVMACIPPHFNSDGILVLLSGLYMYLWLKEDLKLA